MDNRASNPSARPKAGQNRIAYFLSDDPNTLLNQSLKVLVRAMSTTGPQDCPVPVWIIAPRTAPAAAFLQKPSPQTRFAYFLRGNVNLFVDQALSLLVRAMSTTRPQDCPAPMWIVAPKIACSRAFLLKPPPLPRLPNF